MATSDCDSDDLISQMIAGRYRIISRLGAGGMGVAYRAWDERATVPVAIKIPKKSYLEDPKFAERFNREVRLLQGLVHPNIVPIVDVGEHQGLPYVVMRFLPGGSLSNRRLRDDQRKPKPNPIGMLHLWLPSVADALDHVHVNGVVHRDVKPGNIFFDAFWNAFLGDFGIAKIVEESDSFDREHTLTATNMGIGTTEYMAPEQFTPKAAIDGRVDQYALAVIVYEILAGVRPFAGENAHIAVEVLTLSVPPLCQHRPDLPATLVDAVHRGLAKKCAERFATCREFSKAVLRHVPVLEDEPNVARLLCPRCENILKLPTSAAGQRGKCPKCKTRMEVAYDLGALWQVDEARLQRRAGKSAAEQDADQNTRVIRVGEEVDDEALRELKLVSGPTLAGGQVMAKARSAWWAMTPWAVAAVFLAALAWWVWPEPPPTYQQRLTRAEEMLRQNPEDRTANDFLGRHWCFRESDWSRGLPHLAKGGAVGLSPAAQQELELRESTTVMDPGDFIRLASRWWALGNDNSVRLEKEALVIKKHARVTFLEWVDQLVSPTDIKYTNGWLDRDAEFLAFVGNKRPTARAARPDDGAPPPTIAPFDAASARKHQETWAKRLGIEIEMTNSIGQTLVVIPPGRFTIGEGAKTVEVTLTQQFLLGQTEVTNAQWKQVMGSVPSRWKEDERPVEQVSLKDAVDFCKKLSALPEERRAGRDYRLPTEAEWEYACRAGSTTRYSFGDDESLLGDYAWYGSNSGSQTHPVRQKKPNAWNLFDMHGNVFEWCSDWLGDYGSGAVTDPQGLSGETGRGRRGGSWDGVAGTCRSARRDWCDPSSLSDNLGFRLALTPSGVQSFLPEAAESNVGSYLQIELVRVGDPGNPPDTNGFGSVPYEYHIGKYEITNEQYCAFLNAVAKSDPYGLYNEKMNKDGSALSIERTGTEGNYRYQVMQRAPDGHVNAGARLSAQRPISCVSWVSAARFCNWLHNGQSDGDTECGAYALNGLTGVRVQREKGARFFLPTEDE
jgi:formylglycine-generating enzyme required for sulfatase activity